MVGWKSAEPGGMAEMGCVPSNKHLTLTRQGARGREEGERGRLPREGDTQDAFLRRNKI